MTLDVTADILQCNKDDSIQCEDYFKESNYNKDSEDKFYCLCDGASESYDSFRWTKIIANKYLEDKYSNKELFRGFKPEISSSFIKPCYDAYRDEINFDSLSWSHQSSFLRGSFSTMLCVCFVHGKIQIFAVGDSIAFKFRRLKNGKYSSRWCSFPYKSPDEFRNKPTLISSNSTLNDFLNDSYYIKNHKTHWEVKHNDIILLMTDAISEWLMKFKDRIQIHLEYLMYLFQHHDKQEAFKKFVLSERTSKRLRTDDTTIVKLEFREREQ